MLDLDAYLDRIGFTGRAKPDLATLSELHRLHPAAIAFENVDPFLGWPVDLDIGAIQHKLVRGGRGGYCFEHNLLFMHALRAVGFETSGLAARVLWGRPADAVTPRSHMLLRVELDGATWLADVGFGGLTQTAPLRLEPGLEQPTPHEPFRVEASGSDFRMEAKVGGEWRTLYTFDLQHQHDVDYGITSYYLSTNPSSQFVTTLIAARALGDRRLALRNNRLNVHHLDGPTEHHRLGSAAEVAETLEQAFDISLPDAVAFVATVERKGLLEDDRG